VTPIIEAFRRYSLSLADEDDLGQKASIHIFSHSDLDGLEISRDLDLIHNRYFRSAHLRTFLLVFTEGLDPLSSEFTGPHLDRLQRSFLCAPDVIPRRIGTHRVDHLNHAFCGFVRF